jgi:hypothetical protein
MRARDFLIEKVIKQPMAPAVGTPDSDPLYGLKLAIATKIKDLPPDDTTQKALQEIEDLLAHIGAGGRKGHIGAELNAIDDRDVHKARSLLAKYVLSLEMTPQQRTDLFTRWKNDKLVNIKLLLTPGKHSIPDIIMGYDDGKNPAIKELTNDLSQVAALGQGKGEFLLSVLSKRITKLHKGDLSIDGQQIEVKTQDVGGGRFYDQDVRPAADYNSISDKFVKTWPQRVGIKKVPTSGLKLIDMMSIGDALPPAEKSKYYGDVTRVLNSIFPGMDVSKIVGGMKVGNIGAAKQAYAVTNLDYYRGIKKDDAGILFIDLSKAIAEFVFFRDAQELAVGGLRLHAKTVYPVSGDPRNAYPQMSILTSKAGIPANDAPAVAPKAPAAKPAATAKPVKPAGVPPKSAPVAPPQPALAASKNMMGAEPQNPQI